MDPAKLDQIDYEIATSDYVDRLNSALMYGEAGKVTQSVGLIYEANLPVASVGSTCEIVIDPNNETSERIEAEVIGFRNQKVALMPYGDPHGVNSDSRVILKKPDSTALIGEGFLGRVIDGLGRPIDGKGPINLNTHTRECPIYAKPQSPLQREIIREPLDLGVRAINGLLTCGMGQRLGIMAASGVGKSVLLGMMARNTNADINVIALIGERGREVREFIERELGEEGLKKSVVVVATSDTTPLLRVRGAFFAATLADYFSGRGANVLMMMDSVTRFCMAQREIGLSLGEPPATKGYTPSVFSRLPKLLERAGNSENAGSITGLYTVLVEGDDMDEPVADATRSILDGHIVLSRDLARRNHFPAIDVMSSTSRVMPNILSEDRLAVAGKIKESMARYNQVEDLINLGAYSQGTNPEIDQAVFLHKRIQAYLRQGVNESATIEQSFGQLEAISQVGETFLASQQGSDQ